MTDQMQLCRHLLLVLVCIRVAQAADVSFNDSCLMGATEPVSGNVRLVNGTLWTGEPERSYPPEAYRMVPGGYVLCTCMIKPCVQKCCMPNMAYGNNNKCTAFNDSFRPSEKFAVPAYATAAGTIEKYDADKFHLVYGKIMCSIGKYRLIPSTSDADNFRISKTGWLLNDSGSTLQEPGQFCLEQSSEFNFYMLAIVCSKSINEILKSLNDDNFENSPFKKINIIGMILSLPFLFSTFLVYALIRDLRNLHGKSLMCHVASLLAAYTSLIVAEFFTDTIDNKYCIVLAYIIQFSFLASFFWLNIMCFDLWWTFSGFRPLRGNIREHEAKKFIMYSIYSWGCPSLISMITFYMDTFPNTIVSISIRSEFGKNSCWFGSDSALLIYFYGPIGILLFSNLLMFIHTAVMIIKHMRDAKVLKGSESNRNVNNEKQRFMLYLKLFIVMGVNWLAEILSWALGLDGSNGSFLWYMADIGNSLQGVLIFLIFVCKKRVLKLLNKKLCPQLKIFKTYTVSTRTTNSTISRTSTKIKDSVEMTPHDVKNSTSNQLHDFKV